MVNILNGILTVIVVSAVIFGIRQSIIHKDRRKVIDSLETKISDLIDDIKITNMFIASTYDRVATSIWLKHPSGKASCITFECTSKNTIKAYNTSNMREYLTTYNSVDDVINMIAAYLAKNPHMVTIDNAL